MRASIIGCSVLLAVSRLLLPAVPLDLTFMGLYKDVAHIFMGVLLALWLTSDRRTTERRLYCGLFWALTALETAAFVVKSR